MELREHNRFVLTDNITGDDGEEMKPGDVGVIIHVHPGSEAFVAEFLALTVIRRSPQQSYPRRPDLFRTETSCMRALWNRHPVLITQVRMVMHTDSTTGDVIVEARNAVNHFPVKAGMLNNRSVGVVRAVDDVSFTIRENQTFALVGESGCGKTTMANLILKLLDLTSGKSCTGATP